MEEAKPGKGKSNLLFLERGTYLFSIGFQGSNILQAQPERSAPSGEKPLEKFLAAEFNAVVFLVRSVHQSLASVSKVIRGKIVPSTDLLELADDLIKQQVIYIWLFTRCPPKKLLGWVPGVQITSHLKCIGLVYVRSSLPVFAMACE